MLSSKTLACVTLSSVFFFGSLAAVHAADDNETGSAASSAPSISLEGFSDSARHWRHIKDKGNVIQPRPDHPAYTSTQIREIAANVLLFQRECGGWPKNYDMAAILNDAERAAVVAARGRTGDVTFDNDTCHSQIAYLAQAALIVERTGTPDDKALARDYRAAAKRAIEFILSAQYPSGGFPQSWPKPTGYSVYITYNDGVMIGLLSVLRDVAGATPVYAWVDADLRAKCAAAVERGTACILATQYRVPANATRAGAMNTARVASPFAGKLSGWGQQHNNITLKPAPARKFELASLCADDTAANVRFLMDVEKPSAEIIAAIKAGVAWLKDVAIAGTRVETFEAAPAEFQFHNTTKERRVVQDSAAPLIWARMYELDTDRPIFCGRDGVKRYALSEIDRDRRTGYAWYGYWPAKLLESEYAAWLAKHN